MKAFLSGVVLMIVVSAVAWLVLDSLPYGAEDVFTSGRGSVRL